MADMSTFPVTYITAFPHDHLRNRLFVYTIFTLEIIQLLILTKSHFEIFAYDFGDPEAYDRTGALWFGAPFMSSISVSSSFGYCLSQFGCLPASNDAIWTDVLIDVAFSLQSLALLKCSMPYVYICFRNHTVFRLLSVWCEYSHNV